VKGKTMAVEAKSNTKVKTANQRHRPADNHPFRRAFSPRRLSAPDCNIRRVPFTPTVSNGQSSTTKLPWHKRPLPSDWDADEVLFFTNWRNELERLHQALMSTAADRPRLLRKARKRYMRLAYGLKEAIGKAASRASKCERFSRSGAAMNTSTVTTAQA
jgi:hypothetical protein